MDEFERKPSVLLLTDNFPTLYTIDAYMEYRGVSAAPQNEVVVSRNRELRFNTLRKPDHYLDQRIRLLMAAYKERRWKEGDRLVSVTYDVGQRETNLLVLMRTTGQSNNSGSQDEGLCVSYCVTELLNIA